MTEAVGDEQVREGGLLGDKVIKIVSVRVCWQCLNADFDCVSAEVMQ